MHEDVSTLFFLLEGESWDTGFQIWTCTGMLNSKKLVYKHHGYSQHNEKMGE
jgi:hypothetical protein